MFASASNYAKSVDSVMLYIIGVSFLLLLIVTIAMIYFVVRYNRKRNPVASQIEGNKTLEIVWVVIPVLLVLSMFYFGYVSFKTSREVPPDAMVVKVTAKMWAWNFTYPNGKQSDTLVVPVGKPIKFEITSIDVNHSFYIPAFRIKEDAVPGRENYMVVHPKEVGAYDIACAEYCGLQHSLMYTKIFVVPEEEFSLWYEGKVDNTFINTYLASHSSDYRRLLQTNYAILVAKGCIQCHSLDGTKGYGPSFANLNRGYAAVKFNGKDTLVAINKDYLKRAIYQPSEEIVLGYEKNKMTHFTQRLTDDEVNFIVDLLYDNFVQEDGNK